VLLGGLAMFAVLIAVVAACAGLAGSYASSGLAGYDQYTVEEGKGKTRILMLNVEGVIASGEGCAPLVINRLRQLRTKQTPARVGAVLLRVNSPGGTVTACDTIDGEIQKCIAQGIPFVGFYDEVAASGGYYVSARCKPILARPTCVTGSIGVMGLSLNLEKLLADKLGVEAEAMTSVPYKDVPSLFRKMTEAERAYMQKIIDDYHTRFVGIVQRGRGLTEEEVRAFADGRVFLPEDAKRLKMIDAIGDWDDAVAAARKLAGADAPVIGYRRRPNPLELMLQSRSPSPLPDELRAKLKLAAEQRFCYLWLP